MLPPRRPRGPAVPLTLILRPFKLSCLDCDGCNSKCRTYQRQYGFLDPVLWHFLQLIPWEDVENGLDKFCLQLKVILG